MDGLLLEMRSNITTLILCGGRGERLIPLTNTTQKCMLPIQGKPLLEYVVEQIKGFGLNKIIFCCGYRGKDVINHFSSGPVYEHNYEYSWPCRFVNTGARILQAMPLVNTKYIAVFNGDSLCNLTSDQFRDCFYLFKDSKADIAKLAVRKDNSLLSSFIASPIEDLFGAGIYFFKKSYLENLEYNPNLSIEDDIIPNSDIAYIEMPNSCYTIDIGILKNYEEVNNENGLWSKRFKEITTD